MRARWWKFSAAVQQRLPQERAIRFYEKLGTQYEGTAKWQIKINGRFSNLKWYCWLKGQI
ncbi:MAG: hypothetical protein RR011_06155 [Oscillospiraceae bacterium]